MARRLPWLALLLVAACDRGPVITDLNVALPEGDAIARARLTGLEVEVWGPEREACRSLIAWRRAVCGSACAPPPSPRDDGAAPMSETSLAQTDGAFGSAELPLDGDGPWEVLVRGLDDTGAAFLYGCRTVASDEPTTIALFRPWCDTLACAGQLHPRCPVEIDCSADPADDPDGLGPPVCRPLVPVIFAWEQDGVACEPGAGGHLAPCRQARIECAIGRTEPETDGVCPQAADPTCGGTLADDLDCDGRFPGPCEACMVGERASCGTGACAPVATCLASMTYGECVASPGGVESCGGGDEDCDGIEDALDADAFASCNAGREMGAPAADSCDGSTCRCGGGAACVDGACCDGDCVDPRTSDDHCGGCGRECPGGCVAGECEATCTVLACNAGRASNRPRADACLEDACRCGGGPACDGEDACCGGVCGLAACDADAGVPDACVPRAETCGGGDEDCDMVPDGVDPDALADCNDTAPVAAPFADACDGADCRCGAGPACASGFGCCDDGPGPMCVSIETDEHCGDCETACPGGMTCVGGACVP